MSQKLDRAMQIVSSHLTAIKKEVFNAGTEVKLTFIARDPKNSEADFLVSEDDLVQVAEALTRSRQREQSNSKEPS